ncbi:MAG: FkbM family methyltransferase [Fibromonadaceae bacterium]|jgi:FkbM family methyltransferase|nr:FkbM family methyltransferase [Fibromonadaceae bacterium]
MEQLKECIGIINEVSPFDKYFAELEMLYDKICIFGMGSYGTEILPILKKKLGNRIRCVSDNDKNKHGKEYCGIKCVPPHELDKNTYIFVSIFQADDIIAELSAKGFYVINQELQNSFDLFRLYGFRQSGKLYTENYEGLEKVFSLFSDDLSRQIFIRRIQYNILPYENKRFFDTVYSGDQYFPDDIITLNDNETFIDGGGYTGDTIQNFIARTKSNFNSIYSFEVDEKNYAIMNAYIKTLPENLSQKIFIFQYGLSNQEEKIKLIGNGASTHVQKVGGVFSDNFGKLVALDNVVSNKSSVSFIKLDIEGYERNALIGMMETIKNSKPKMAVCIYHKPEDVYEIPLLLHEMNPAYRFFLRHHGHDWNYAGETVLYVIPEKNI